MQHPDIWGKFSTTSRFMERTLDEFDQSYQRGSRQGEPGFPQRAATDPAPGLRDLYCFWIDAVLGSIEGAAATWYANARRVFSEHSYGSEDAGIRWLANVMTPNGLISPASMQLLRANNQHPAPGGDRIWLASNYLNLWDPQLGRAGPF